MHRTFTTWGLNRTANTSTARMSEDLNTSVSMSMTTALIYGVSGSFFFLLVFLLVMMGLTNCDWNCNCFKSCYKKRKQNQELPSRLDWTFVDIEKRSGAGNGIKPMYPPAMCRAVATAPAPMVRQLSSNSSFLHMEFWETEKTERVMGYSW